MGHELDRLRQQMDEINMQLLELLSQRAELAQRIGEVKKTQGIHRFDPVRERNMLEKLTEVNPGPFDDDTIRHLFKQIFKAALDLQQEDHKKALLVSRKRQPEDTVVQVGEVSVGGNSKTVVAGPCSVESEEQVRQVAQAIRDQGLTLLRGGAFKPRSSPYDFQGLGEEGLRILRKVADEFQLKWSAKSSTLRILNGLNATSM